MRLEGRAHSGRGGPGEHVGRLGHIEAGPLDCVLIPLCSFLQPQSAA